MCLVARHLEAHGIPTVALASAQDIMLAGRAPRTVFVDYPLGHTAGRPFDRADQLEVVRSAVQALATVRTPGTIITLPNRWPDDTWRAEASSTEARDTRQPRDTSPQFERAGDRDAAIAAGTWAAA